MCLLGPAAAADALWIDVRSPEEYAAGHLAGAINVPHRDIATRIAAIAPDRQARLKLYCRRGVRAETARFSLEALGYQNVSNEGGYEAILQARTACKQDASAC
ncbi:MAG: rhodanese-like domain-containing protein [Gammaproteobacteria bacterium]